MHDPGEGKHSRPTTRSPTMWRFSSGIGVTAPQSVSNSVAPEPACARLEPRRVDQVRRADRGDVHLDRGVRPDDRAGRARVVEVDVREEDVAEVLEAETALGERRPSVRQRAGRPAVVQRERRRSVSTRKHPTPRSMPRCSRSIGSRGSTPGTVADRRGTTSREAPMLIATTNDLPGLRGRGGPRRGVRPDRALAQPRLADRRLAQVAPRRRAARDDEDARGGPRGGDRAARRGGRGARCATRSWRCASTPPSSARPGPRSAPTAPPCG